MISHIALQNLIASPFLTLGAWCLFAPEHAIRTCFHPDFAVINPTSNLLCACFGSQAMLGGLFLITSKPTRLLYQAYGLALLPYFAFDYWVYHVGYATPAIWLDVIGNVLMLGCCVLGNRLLANEEEKKKKKE